VNGQPKSVFGFLNKTTIAPVAAHYYEIKEQHPTLGFPPYKLSFDFELIDEKKVENVPVLVNLTGDFRPAPQSGKVYAVRSIELMTISKTVAGTLSTFTTQGGVKYYLTTAADEENYGYEKPNRYTLILSKATASKTADLIKDLRPVDVAVKGVAHEGYFAVTAIKLR
jgi:hypothetical protein